MPARNRPSFSPDRVLCVIMGGGGGKRLFPLTRDRAIPAVPLAGSYRLVDVPISNCINSGLQQIYILTQFNSASLHRHVSQAYKFDQFSPGVVEILAAEQTLTDRSWYQGSADAVRKNLPRFLTRDFEYAVILSADQLYRLDFRTMLDQHVRTGADLTIATVPVTRAAAPHLGILQIDGSQRIQRFVEKPTDPAVLDSLRSESSSVTRTAWGQGNERFLASMGIYVFSRGALESLLNNTHVDFGKEIIPEAIRSHRLFAYLFGGYWEDLGSIRAYFDAHLDLVADSPRFNFFELTGPIFSQPLYLPGAKINRAEIEHTLVAAGCVINQASIRQCIIGLRSLVGSGSQLLRVVSMGCDYYETPESVASHERSGVPLIGIGRNTRIENTIIDRNARIGDNVVITPAGKPENVDHDNYFIRDGVVIVPRNGVIPHDTVI